MRNTYEKEIQDMNNRIARLRYESGMTQEHVANALGIDVRVYRRYEYTRGDYRPIPSYLIPKLVKIHKTSFEFIFGMN